MAESNTGNRIVFRVHAIRRMFERSISEEDVVHTVRHGRTILEYADDKPYPSRLVLGWRGPKPLHAVVARNESMSEDIVVTVYEPSAAVWDEKFEKRKESL